IGSARPVRSPTKRKGRSSRSGLFAFYRVRGRSAVAAAAAAASAAAAAATAAATAVAAAAPAAAEAAAAARGALLGVVDAQRAAVEVLAVHAGDRVGGLGLRAHRHEGEAAGLAAVAIDGEVDFTN